MNTNNMDFNNIPKEMFEFCQQDANIHDKKFDTKPVGYFKDAMMRFCRNKSSVIAAIIILCLFLFAFCVPIFFSNAYTQAYEDTDQLLYSKLLPTCDLFAWAGWDGCKDETLSEDNYNKYMAIGIETGLNPIAEVYRADYEDPTSNSKNTFYDVSINTYYKLGMYYMNLTQKDYEAIQAWQNETGIQVIYPAVNTKSFKVASLKNDANLWYQCTNKGMPKLDKNGNYKALYKTTGNDGGYDSLRIPGDDGSYRYAVVGGTSEAPSYRVRVSLYTYFQYKFGEEPSFLFGTDAYGLDIVTRLANAARFSFLLAFSVSIINLLIGAIYGAIEGYYGGTIDLVLERISDILGGVPFMVVATLFQLHLKDKLQSPVIPLLFAFVLTGWIGMASSVRMQFYRYKKQEYVLAARTLGASDARLMFRHIFPNALGTLITGAVLTIPSVVYSESNLTYLGIVNLESAERTSIGTMLSSGQAVMDKQPHIILFPAIFISLMMISFNLFGNGLRDAFNPSLRGTED